MAKKERNTLLLCTFYALMMGFTLHDYFIVDATFVVGLAVLAFCFKNFDNILRGGNFSNRYLLWLLPTTTLAISTSSFTFFYLACVGAILWVWESRIGKLSALPPILLLIMSPIFRYATDVFTFDFRLKLTQIAAHILQKIDPSVKAVGNLVQLNDSSEWQVDEACMGLNMLGVSLILSIFFIAYFSNRLKKRPLLRGVFVLLVTTLFLNYFCNLLRIIALVHFKVLPHTIGHDMIGLLALAIYVVTPMFFLIKKVIQYDWFFNNKNRGVSTFPSQILGINSWKNITINTFFIIILLTKSVFLFYKKPNATVDTTSNFTLNGFEKMDLPNGICQLSNDSFLIYIKPLKSFYTTEHSPMICWKGSGFVFQKIEKIKVNNAEIYTGILTKDNSTMYTAWWFENEWGERTVDQIVWRWATFTEGCYPKTSGGHFRLVNVNAANRGQLMQFIANY